MIAIKTDHLTKYYANGRIQALEDLSLEVASGKIFSLLGPNGAGKTTLIKLLLGICHPTRGTAQILGRHIEAYQVHSDIGYLSENHHFQDFLNAEQILHYYGKMGGVSVSTLKERIPQLLNLVKLTEWGKTKIRKYSKGMMQRLGIAQALINDPQLLFLDEPTDGIDPVGRKEVRDILINLRNTGKTIFLNSHLLSEVERVSDEIAILKQGRLIQRGSVQQFISIRDTFQIKLEDPENKAAPIARDLNIQVKNRDGLYLVSVRDDQQLNHYIDELRKRKVVIQAIIPYKISLEDFFIEVLEEKK